MMKKILIVGLLLVVVVIFVPKAMAVFDPLCQHVDATTGQCTEGVCADPQASQGPVCQQNQSQIANNQNPVAGPKGIIKTAANIIAIVAGIGAVIIIIFSGITFVTAGGSIAGQRSGDSPSRAKTARASLTGALVGLVIIALSWSIVTFITDRFVHS